MGGRRGGALKVAHADHELARSRLVREAEALAAIGPPAVPRLDDRGVLDSGRAWIAMERIVGTSLAELTTQGPLGIDRAITVVLAILEALGHVHAARLVHRDLKPENLVLRPDGTIAILDLGLARKLPVDPDDPTRANVQVGSLEYVPPEQLLDAASVDVRADLYAVGCILYELCAGRPPFLGDADALRRAHAALRPPRLGAMAALPAVLEAACMDCLAKDPGKRPRDVAELVARLLATRDAPSVARSSHAVSQISDSKQPVVLLWVELPKVERSILGMFSARQVLVLSQRGRRVLAALLGAGDVDPATTALGLARDLAASGARIAIHLDALRVEGTTLHGEAVEKPESWLPVGDWSGVLLTNALAAVAQVPTRAAEVDPRFRSLADEGARGEPLEVELFGRDRLLTELVADAAMTLRGKVWADHRSGSGTWTATGPAFALLVGEPGVGKTVVAAALARRIAALGARVHVATVPAPGAGARPPLAGLIGTPEGPAVRAIGSALRAAARERPTVVILDDLHLAEHDLLDALEYATLGGEALPLWVLGLAAPRLDARRPHLGAGAEHRRHEVLEPLDEDAAVTMATALLRPAEYPPLLAVRRLVSLAHRNPLHITMLAREIHERGAIRKRPGGEFFLDTNALTELEPIALGPWLAGRALSGLAPELVALARVCATLGDQLDRDELAAVVEAVERRGGPTTLIDLDVGLRELVSAGVLVQSVGGFVFCQPLVEEGIYATTEETVRRMIHDAALAHSSASSSTTTSITARIARHAEAVGAADIAAAAFATLGGIAEREHRTFDAEHAWSGALRHLEARETRRARALLGLARAHRQLQRLHHARAALVEATAIAAERGDVALEIETLLEHAMVRDFAEDYDGSREIAAIARARFDAGATGARGLGIDVELAEARGIYREQRFVEAAPLLRNVLADAREHGRVGTAMIAALMLGCALSDLRELDEAERVFHELIEDCERYGDRFHLAAAYGNRAWLWSARGNIARIADDLRLATQLAREVGHAYMERNVTHNLAEQLLWENQLDEALQLARRGLALQERAGEGATSLDRLLLARVLAARGDLEELREVLATFAADERAGEDAAAGTKTIDVLRAIATGATADAWRIVLQGTETVFLQMRLELWQLAARHGHLSADHQAQAIELARTDPVWVRRLHDFRGGTE